MASDTPPGATDKSISDLFAGWRWALAIMALLVFAFFSRFLLTGRFFLMRDLIFDFFAREQFYKTHLLKGELPLWNHYTGGGEPFLSNMESAVFYPPNLLYLLFPVPNANVILVTLHVLLAGFGVWLACRAWRISQHGSLLAAISFAFSTQMVTRIEFFSFLSSLAWFPLVVALFTLWLKQPSLRKFLLLALALSLQFLGGYPEAVLFTAGTLVIYALVVGGHANLGGKGRIDRTWLVLLGLAGMGGVAILLSLAQILPVLNIVPLSARSIQDPLAEQASVNPAMWLTALFPYLYGVPGYYGKYWAPACMEFWLGTFYVGILPVMLGTTALIRRGLNGRGEPADLTGDPIAGKRTLFLLVILLCFMLYAMGSYTPFFGLLWKIVPPLQWFRWPAKALMVVCFALCCLGGVALDWLGRQRPSRNPDAPAWRQNLVNYTPMGLWLTLAAVAAVSLFDNGRGGEWILRSFFNLNQVTEQFSHRIPWDVLTDDCLKFILLAVLSTVLVQIYIFRPEKRQTTFWVLLAVLFCDLLTTTYPLLRSSDMDIMRNSSDYKTLFRSGKLEGRIYRQFSQQYNYGVKNEKLLRLARDTMVGYWAMVDKVHNIRPGGDFKLRNYMDLYINYELSSVPEPYLTKILKLLGASYFLESALQPGYFEEGDIFVPRLYAIEGAVPDAVVVGQAVGFASWDDLLSDLVYGDHDLSQVALLESADLARIGQLDGSGPIKHEIIEYANRLNGLTVTVESAAKGLLVINATYYPSWRATVNGLEAPIYQANGPFRAIEIPAGRSVVEMDYHPRLMLIGLYLSLGCLAVVLALLYLSGRTGGPGRPEQAAKRPGISPPSNDGAQGE